MSRVLSRVAPLFVGFLGSCACPPPAPAAPAGRLFELEYEVVLPQDLDPAGGPIRVWVPVPASDGRQEVTVLERPAAAEPGGPDRHGNLFSSVLLMPGRGGPTSVSWRYRIHRGVDHGGGERGTRELAAEWRERLYLGPERLVPVGGPAAPLADEALSGREEPFAVARALYDRVLEVMEYRKNGVGWGAGSTEWACAQRYGNCTDFHALFISMARYVGLPARFQIGFALPPERGRGELSGYHCWAHFYVQGHGWIPVDISEADKDPGRAEFFFGRLDADRVALSFGRDIVLDPPQQGEPLNYFVYAYAEQGGRPLDLRTRVRFRDL